MLVLKQALRVLRLCFLGTGGTHACQWDTVNEFLFLLYFCTQLFLKLLNCRYLDPWVFLPSFCFLCFPSSYRRVRDWVRVWFLARVNPPHCYRFCKEKAPMLSCGRKGVLINSKTLWKLYQIMVASFWYLFLLPNSGGEPGGLAGERALKFI